MEADRRVREFFAAKGLLDSKAELSHFDVVPIHKTDE